MFDSSLILVNRAKTRFNSISIAKGAALLINALIALSIKLPNLDFSQILLAFFSKSSSFALSKSSSQSTLKASWANNLTAFCFFNSSKEKLLSLMVLKKYTAENAYLADISNTVSFALDESIPNSETTKFCISSGDILPFLR